MGRSHASSREYPHSRSHAAFTWTTRCGGVAVVMTTAASVSCRAVAHVRGKGGSDDS